MKGMWLGFLFFVALLLLGFATLLVKNIKLIGKRQEIRAHFTAVQGLRKGDDVRVDGLSLGKVTGIDLDPRGGVMVSLELDQPVQLFQDSKIMVGASSVLGGSAVSIARGMKPPALDLSQPVRGDSQPGFEEISKIASDNRDSLKQAIDNIRDITQSLKDGQGTIPKLLKSSELHDKLSATVDKAQEAITEFKKVGQNVNKLTEKIDKGEGPLGALLNDKKMTEKLSHTLDNVEKTSENLTRITDKVDKGEGTLGRLLNDRDMADRLKKTVENVEKSSESIRNITGKLENGEGTVGRLLQDDELYEKAKQTLDDVDKMLARAARAQVEVIAESKQYDDTGVNISKVGIRISPTPDKYFQVGAAFLSLDREGDILFKSLVEDDESSTEIVADIQVAYRIPWFLDHRLTLRGGLIEGKPGGALDFRWEDWGFFTHPVTFTFEARDAYNDLDDEDIDEQLDGAMIRAYVKFPLWTRKETWLGLIFSSLHVYAGVSRLGEDGEGMVGLAIEFPDEDIRTLVSLLGLAR